MLNIVIGESRLKSQTKKAKLRIHNEGYNKYWWNKKQTKYFKEKLHKMQRQTWIEQQNVNRKKKDKSGKFLQKVLQRKTKKKSKEEEQIKRAKKKDK